MHMRLLLWRFDSFSCLLCVFPHSLLIYLYVSESHHPVFDFQICLLRNTFTVKLFKKKNPIKWRENHFKILSLLRNHIDTVKTAQQSFLEDLMMLCWPHATPFIYPASWIDYSAVRCTAAQIDVVYASTDECSMALLICSSEHHAWKSDEKENQNRE